MNVLNLQQFLSQIAILVRAAGAAEKVSADVERLAHCLQPFAGRTLSEFSVFLEKADEYDRTGKLAPPPKSPSRPRKESTPRQPQKPVMSVDEAVATFNALFDRATETSLEYPAIDAAIDEFEPIKAPQLKEIAKKVNVPVSSKATKPQILEELKRKVRNRKASFERGPDRPTVGP